MSGFCKFCGSQNIVKASYTATSGEPTVEGNLSFGDMSGGISYEAPSDSTAFNTEYCKTCRKINCLCDQAPMVIDVTVNMEHHAILLPFLLNEALKDVSAQNHIDEQLIIRSVKPVLEDHIENYTENGENPCRFGEIGYPMRLLYSEQEFKLHILFDSYVQAETDMIACRLVYGGGKSLCH